MYYNLSMGGKNLNPALVRSVKFSDVDGSKTVGKFTIARSSVARRSRDFSKTTLV